MKFIFLSSLMALSSICYSQDQNIELGEKDGLSISYKLSKLKSDNKKDTYVVVCNAKNNSDNDLYYEASENKVNPIFSTITIRNANSFTYLIGTESKLFVGKKPLFYIKKGGSVSSEKEFKVNKGETPVLTNQFNSDLKTIIEFR